MSRPAENATPRSIPARLLGWIACLAASRARLMLWLVLLVACASVGISVTQLQFRTSRADLMDPASRFAKTWKEYSNTFGAESDLMVVVQTPAPNGTLIRNVIDDLGGRLSREPEYFRNVVSNVDLTAMREKALLFLTPQQAQRTASLVQRYEPVVRDQQWSQLRAEQLARGLQQKIEASEAEGAVPEATWRSVERYASSLASYMRHSLETGKVERNGFRPPLPDLMTVAADQGLTDARLSYILNDENTVGVIQVTAVRSEKFLNGDPNAPAIRRLRDLLNEVQKDHQPDTAKLTLMVTGLPAIEHDEMRSTSIDMKNAGLVAILVVGGMLFLAFRGIRHPMLSLLTLIVAISWTFGAATLVVRHLNIISICFPVFLIGMGIDFSVSFINRYLTLRQELYELPDALKEAAETTGIGILTSAITTALAFSTAMLTGYPGLAELGLISAIGVLLCAMSTFVFLPALITLSDSEYEVDALPQPFSPAMLRKVLVAWPAVSIAIGIAGLAFFGYQAFSYRDGSLQCRVGYDANLMALKDASAESVKAERVLEASAVDTVLYAVSVASTWEQASDLRAKYLRLPGVARVSDLASKLPDRPDAQTLQTIRDLQARASSLRTSLPNIPQADFRQVGKAVDQLFLTVRKSKNPAAQRAAAELDQFLNDLVEESKKSSQRCNEILSAYNDMTARWLLTEYAEIATADNFSPVAPRDLPSELTRRYVWADRDTKEQKWVLRIYPKADVWDGQALATFVEELRTVDPNVTGVPVQNYESAGQLHHTYAAIGLYALAVISLVLLYNYLRPGQKLMTIIPPVAVAAFIGYTLFRRNGAIDPSLLVIICLGLAAFIATVLDYRNLRDTGLTLVPAIAGGIVLLGLMSLLGLKLNPVSLIALPLVFAIGIDNGIYLVSDCRKQIAAGKDSFEPSVDTLSSILVTSLTSIVGFGSLMIASHQGLFSIGVLLALGVASSLIVSLV
ncbi:MAG: MMPL family transporter, partial [Planctomycetota bacterium]